MFLNLSQCKNELDFSLKNAYYGRMIIQNAVKITEDGKETFLVSSSVHHFNQYTFKDGSTFAVDGGKEYLRRVGDLNDSRVSDFYSLNDTQPFHVIKELLLWGTRGKSGQEKVRYILLWKCSTPHLQAILKDFLGGKYGEMPKDVFPTTWAYKVIVSLLKDRHEKYKF
jgi:hypothetical protein